MGIRGQGRESVGIAVKATDVLFVLAWSSIAFTLRGIANLRPKDGGEAVPLTVDATVTSDRLTSSGKLVIMQDGVIDSASYVGLGTGPTQRGQCFTQFFVTRGGASSIYAVLCAGYVYTGSQLGFGVIEQPGPAGGQGALSSLSQVAPGAGANSATQNVPTGAKQKVREIDAPALVTGVAAANRRATFLHAHPPGTAYTIVLSGGFQPASTTVSYNAAIGCDFSDASDFALGVTDESEGSMPDIVLDAADTFRFFLARIQAADQVPAINYLIEEWVMPN